MKIDEIIETIKVTLNDVKGYENFNLSVETTKSNKILESVVFRIKKENKTLSKTLSYLKD